MGNHGRPWLGDPATLGWIAALLAVLLLAAALGYWLHRVRAKRRQQDGPGGDKAFFKGVQYILSNDHDHAIEEFTKAVQLNSDTIETYVALGNLYRSKGDIDRAIRIRQSIILRPNIDETLKLRALFDLGLDYRKGGFLHRALETFLKVAQHSPGDDATLAEIERIYEEMHEWEKAYQTRQKIARLRKGEHAHILAHHLVEMGKAAQKRGDAGRAKTHFQKAISTDPGCVDAYLHLGDWYFERKDYKSAVTTWKRVARVAPQFAFLAYRRLERAYREMKNLKPIEEFLSECAKSHSDAFTHLALARYLHRQQDLEGALHQVAQALALEPTFWEARRFKGELLLAHGRKEEALEDYEELIQRLDMPYLKFQCSRCGLQLAELHWQCPQCRQWDTIHLVDSGPGPQADNADHEPAVSDPDGGGTVT